MSNFKMMTGGTLRNSIDFIVALIPFPIMKNTNPSYEQIQKSILRWVDCSEEELEMFIDIARPQLKTYKRKEIILHESDISQSLYFINKGCIRYFYNRDGEEKTGQFFFENGWYTDLDSFLTGEPSEQTIQALEPAELLLISKDRLYRLYEEVPIFERFGRVILEYSFIGDRRENKNRVNLSPEYNYLRLIRERPKVLERVALRYIASYLGIKPESLSRIRKRIFDDQRKP